MNEDEIFEFLKVTDGPWKIYLNPLRSDGVFIAQDRPHEPYRGIATFDGSPVYPATPRGAYAFPYQLPVEIAVRLIDRLNANIGSVTLPEKK